MTLDDKLLANSCWRLKTLDLTPFANLAGPSIGHLVQSFPCYYVALHTVTLPLVHEARFRAPLPFATWVEAERTATAVVMKRREVARRERADVDGGSRDAGPAAKKGHRTERR